MSAPTPEDVARDRCGYTEVQRRVLLDQAPNAIVNAALDGNASAIADLVTRLNIRASEIMRLHDERAAALRAARAAAIEEAARWQPIETAPKDERRVLVWNGAEMRTARRYPYGEGWAYSDGYGWCLLSPTHWMPLPAPPAAIRALGEESAAPAPGDGKG